MNCTGCIINAIRNDAKIEMEDFFIPECINNCPYKGIIQSYNISKIEGDNRIIRKKRGNGKRKKKNGFKKIARPTGSSRPCYHKHWR